jgi:hypothetical protein
MIKALLDKAFATGRWLICLRLGAHKSNGLTGVGKTAMMINSYEGRKYTLVPEDLGGYQRVEKVAQTRPGS